MDNNNNFMGIVFIILHGISISILFAMMKYMSVYFRATDVVFLYKATLLICVIPWVLFKKFKVFAIPNLKLILIRAILSSIASLSFMFGLQYVNMTNAVALLYLEQIIWLFMGVVFFHEKITAYKLLAVLSCVIGAFFVIFPKLLYANTTDDLQHFNIYYLFILCSICCWGINAGVMKKIAKSIQPEVQILYTMFFATIIAGAIALLQWESVTLKQFSVLIPVGINNFNLALFQFANLKFVIMISICYFTHSISFIMAVRSYDFGVIIPYDYMKIVFIGALNYVLFNEVGCMETWLGYGLIVTGGVLLTRLEYGKKTTSTKSNG